MNPPRYKYEGFERAALKLLLIIAKRGREPVPPWADDAQFLNKLADELDTPLNTRL